ncbi:GNAT family N-acetyltransferase [Paludibacterium yongneupense]|uniref:GNAT family N-acetyltransferase n=1 Tax=Paludibacterium yongneupense TaxID=400061 RepID=UPI0003FFB5DF|nr:GNAT family N-acetyltransferase [Paludibacterium yongneupense]
MREKLCHGAWQDLDIPRREALKRLLTRVWPGDEAPDLPWFDACLEPYSVWIAQNGIALAHAAILHKTVRVGGESFLACGLSCVATDPDFRGRGLGRRVLADATWTLLEGRADFAVFTCDRELLPFYAESGWREADALVLRAGEGAAALSSEHMPDKAVLLRLMSPRARAAAAHFSHGVLTLGLPDGQFW